MMKIRPSIVEYPNLAAARENKVVITHDIARVLPRRFLTEPDGLPRRGGEDLQNVWPYSVSVHIANALPRRFRGPGRSIGAFTTACCGRSIRTSLTRGPRADTWAPQIYGIGSRIARDRIRSLIIGGVHSRRSCPECDRADIVQILIRCRLHSPKLHTAMAYIERIYPEKEIILCDSTSAPCPICKAARAEERIVCMADLSEEWRWAAKNGIWGETRSAAGTQKRLYVETYGIPRGCFDPGISGDDEDDGEEEEEGEWDEEWNPDGITGERQDDGFI